ncbi:MAG: 3-beta hydroxysteroid dehydrogenase/isomerase [Candidatus Gottesmanbacteria bacterium GW2011_GWC2_39_8]|uniref:3-beta hydroxysteroid dehydrogenase/isomerase n=1 Tax=Candidatus Gottesmanbacteria bacterium GW2011_GWC2_39_8 TaxID=1618450 RepID=A0A0G0SZE8_9BACT|nr:MAG: 3-beta hydroxysteroid dehydrogenase/isomerase [Candidatus Gottesmanbacteria bacterium GW2011_GWC2_39_8]
MKILVVGGTGFTGSRVLPLLAGRGQIRCLLRPGREIKDIGKLNYELVYGDLEDIESLTKAMEGCESLINIASMGFGHVPKIVKCAEEVGIRRAVFVSTTAIFTQINTHSKKTRKEAEECVMRSGLEWTILRPTMIYGTPDDRNMIRLLSFIKRWRVMPIPGSGKRLQQPVHVEDLAWAIVNAFFSTKTICKAYNISGRQPLDFNQVVDFAAQALGIKVYKIHVPFTLLRRCFKVYEYLVPNPKLKEEQLLRLNEDKVFGYEQAYKDFGYSPKSFQDGIQQEAILAGYRNIS